ncbi:MAG: biopolymer transporter ExbD [Gammaproteobacteria bacterium]|nr:biopolymer transporter ExbD [Gammaproteobacteria bacterium]
MNLRPERSDERVEINLTPLIDVVFLLLIFFMVSTTFDRHARLKVSLPEASAKTSLQQKESLVLTIDAKGNYFINDRQVINQSLDTLKQAITKSIGEDKVMKDVSLVLRADANTPHQAVVRAMDAASQLGLSRLSIATVEAK